LTGIVFKDTNGNGQQDGFEPGVPNVGVNITDSSGNSQTITTNGNGEYEASVLVGVTAINVDESTLLQGLVLTAGSNPATVDILPGGKVGNNVGYYHAEETGEICVIFFENTNGDRYQNPDEPGIPGVNVEITYSNPSITITKTTNANGKICTKVPRGGTTIDIDDTTLPPGLVLTAGSDFTIHNVEDNIVVDMNGYQLKRDEDRDEDHDNKPRRLQSGMICVLVWENFRPVTFATIFQDTALGEPGLPGVDVTVTNSVGSQTLITDANGEACTTIPFGPTIVEIDFTGMTLPPGLVMSSPGFSDWTVHNVQTSLVYDFNGYD